MTDDADSDDFDDGSGPEPIIDPKEPKSSRGWLAQIEQAEKAFDTWQDKSDSIDRQFANLEKLAGLARSREFQMFWANVQVLGPSIYSRPPVPVVTPRFKNGNKVARLASELIERACLVSFETQDLDSVMRLLRDDLNVVARGAAWLDYNATKKDDSSLGQQVVPRWVSRRDFLHDPARTWAEVDWVANRSWLTKREARKRFRKTSNDAYKNAAYEVRKDENNEDGDTRLKAGFWEIWSKSLKKVFWVTEGVDVMLDEGKQHLDLEGGFPCPRPVFGTTQRNSCVPVPDFMFYKDQIEEINELTGRIAALSEAVRLKGFYPGGAGEVSDAIETAIARNNDNAIIVPISNWSMLGQNANPKDMILWLPIDMVASTIQKLIELRRQLFDDVYQIMGLSDIMRGQTEASETLGAQQLKSQYGSVRIRDKRDELVRVARDITRLTAEIMSENFTSKSLLDMSQMEIPSEADVKKQIAQAKAQFRQQLEDAQSDPQLMQQAEENPQQAQQVIAQAEQALQQQIAEIEETVTIEQVMKFLRDNRTRAFTLDIETDSTIAPDENEQKQRMTEYVTAMGGLIQQAIPTVKEVPQAAPLLAEIIKKANTTFRVGRDFEQVVEEFTEQMKAIASQPAPEGPTPEQIQQQADQQRAEADAAKAQAAAAKQEGDAQVAQGRLALDQQKAQSDAKIREQANIIAQQKIELDRYLGELAAKTTIDVAQIGAQTDTDAQMVEAHLAQEIGAADQAHEREVVGAEQQHQQQLQAEQHAHEQQMQVADHQQQAVAQDSAQQAAAQQAAMKPQPGGQ